MDSAIDTLVKMPHIRLSELHLTPAAQVVFSGHPQGRTPCR